MRHMLTTWHCPDNFIYLNLAVEWKTTLHLFVVGLRAINIYESESILNVNTFIEIKYTPRAKYACLVTRIGVFFLLLGHIECARSQSNVHFIYRLWLLTVWKQMKRKNECITGERARETKRNKIAREARTHGTRHMQSSAAQRLLHFHFHSLTLRPINLKLINININLFHIMWFKCATSLYTYVRWPPRTVFNRIFCFLVSVEVVQIHTIRCTARVRDLWRTNFL